MTKDGGPSRLTGIRYFHGDFPGYQYLDNAHALSAFGRRLAWWLNGEGVSLGPYLELYILFQSNLAVGAVELIEPDFVCEVTWWHRLVRVGVDEGFFEHPEIENLGELATIDTLKVLRPDHAGEIDRAVSIVRNGSNSVRFLVREKVRKDYIIQAAVSITPHPKPCYLHISLIRQSDGAFLDSAPIRLRFHDDAFHLVGALSLTGNAVKVTPPKSFDAQMTVASTGIDGIEIPLSAFREVMSPPAISGLIKRQG